MENVVFSLETGQVTGVDRQPLPFEKEIKVPYDLNLTKLVEHGSRKVQKKDEEGHLLYMTNIVTDEEGILESFDETTEAVEVLETETKTVLNKWKDADGTLNEQEVIVTTPIKTQERLPVLVDEPVYETVLFEDSFMDFTYEEVIEAKVKAINNNNLYDLIHFNEDLAEGTFSLNLSDFKADLGNGVAIIHGGAKLRTEKISLSHPVTSLMVYTEKDSDITVEVGATASSFSPVINGRVVFEEPTNAVYIRFTNNAESKRELHAFGILV